MNKTALITGASSGIGREFAHIHAQRGGNLVLVARRKKELEDLKTELENEYGIDAYIISKDLSNIGASREVYDEVKSKDIDVDYLINNAGFGGLGKFHEREIQQDLSMIQLNISALTELTYYFLQDFTAKNAGKILNVSSTASLMPGPLQAVYYATKAYVRSFSNALAEELHDTNVTVTNLMPGATATEFGKVSGMDKTSLFNKTASAHEVAKDGYYAMLKGKLDVISGIPFSLRMMIAMVPLSPKKMVLSQTRRMQEVR